MLSFKSFPSAETTLAGIELAHRIHKGQFNFGSAHDGASLKQLWDLALADVDPPREDSRGGLLPSTANAPELRDGTRHRICSVRSSRRAAPALRYARKFSDGGVTRYHLPPRPFKSAPTLRFQWGMSPLSAEAAGIFPPNHSRKKCARF